MAKKTTDSLTFDQAFAYFRKKHGGDGGKFRYKGKVYTTNLKKAAKKSLAKPTSARRKAPAKPTGQAPGKPPKIAGGKRKPRASKGVVVTDLRPGRAAPKAQTSNAKAAARFTLAGLFGLGGSTKAGQARRRSMAKNAAERRKRQGKK